MLAPPLPQAKPNGEEEEKLFLLVHVCVVVVGWDHIAIVLHQWIEILM